MADVDHELSAIRFVVVSNRSHRSTFLKKKNSENSSSMDLSGHMSTSRAREYAIKITSQHIKLQ